VGRGHLLPLITGRVPGAEPVWNLSRLHLAADVTGVALTRHHLPRFITRTRERTEDHAPDPHDAADDSAPARMRMDGRALTGYTFGARGQMFARIYDKTRQATPDAPIRETWQAHSYDPEHDGTVWRVEFELRRHVLRQLSATTNGCPTTPPPSSPARSTTCGATAPPDGCACTPPTPPTSAARSSLGGTHSGAWTSAPASSPPTTAITVGGK
jgi:hypothetical protein